ncbi:MAG: hypothetical protein COA78_38435 [Blastopirellula sp.]|nr:MAG: hypothetical protein COA78_38435 [Blastopirellula sp.]
MIREKSMIVTNDGVWIGDIYASWDDLMDGKHVLIQDKQAFLIGMHVGRHIASLLAANDDTT